MRHPRAKRAGRRAWQVCTLAGVVPQPPGGEEAATDCSGLGRRHWGTPLPLALLWEATKMPVCGQEGGGGGGAKRLVVIMGTG